LGYLKKLKNKLKLLDTRTTRVKGKYWGRMEEGPGGLTECANLGARMGRRWVSPVPKGKYEGRLSVTR